jgi:endonuclease-3
MPDETIASTIDDFARRKAKYAPVAQALADLYGLPMWREDTPPMDELISCILSQNTNDTNRDRGFDSLKARFPAWQDVVDAPTDDVIDAIRVAGLANQKGPRIQEVLRTIYDENGDYSIDFLDEMPLEEARTWLTNLNGIGPKTAAIVLCFAFNRPAFPVDTHIYRVSKRLGFLPEKISVEKAHPVMEALVPPDDYYAFHINLIQHGRNICNARSPKCERCPLTEYCDYYERVVEHDE